MTDGIQENYQKLPGTNFRDYLFSFSVGLPRRDQLWEGKTHLLRVRSKFVREEYKRLYYEDLEGLFSRKTNKGMWINVVSLVLFGLLFLLGFSIPVTISYSVLLGLIFGSPPLIVFFTNLVEGPTCETYVQTPARQYRLASLDRMKYVNRFLKRIRPKINEHQSSVNDEEMRERYLHLAAPERERAKDRAEGEAEFAGEEEE